MRNSSEIWCETSDITIDEIERRARLEFDNGGYPTLIFISYDLNAQIAKTTGNYNTGGFFGSTIMSVHTSVGALNIKPVARLRNFLLIGRQEDFDALQQAGFDPVFWNDEERLRIEKAFEDLVILEGKNET